MTGALVGTVLVSFGVFGLLVIGGAIASRRGSATAARWRSVAGWISVAGQAVTLALALAVLFAVRSDGAGVGGAGVGGIVEASAGWFNVGSLEVLFSLQADGLQSLMAVTVAAVSLLVHLFSVGYMAEDRDRVLYFAELSLFSGAMLLLVLAGDLVFLYLGWELVGASSYLLISYYFERPAAASAGKKAFLVTRTGDMGLLLAVFAIAGFVGSTDLGEVLAFAEGAGFPGGWATAVPLLVFAGAVGKSAQFPLHVWLPDAMEGPTPVSALIHAATMVAAGVYLVARLFAVFAASEAALAVVVWIGAVTALGAAGAAVAQTDIKRVLAYSTISQLGFMVAALGALAPKAAIFHLFTHAWFKALLFLGAGSVIHATGRQTVEELGGLRREMPVTTWTFVIGAVSLAGIPPLAGFFSKEEILAGVAGEAPVAAALLLIAAFLTAFYALRLVFLTFFGEAGSEAAAASAGGPGSAHGGVGETHESGPAMLVPMIFLAVGAVVAGAVGIASLGEVLLDHIEESLPVGGAHAEGVWLWTLAVVLALAGAAGAWLLYGRGRGLQGDRVLSGRLGPVHGWLAEGYRLDALYDRVLVAPIVRGSRLLSDRLDVGLIDGAVNGIARAVPGSGRWTRRAQSGALRHYVAGTAFGIVVLSLILWRTL